jgi:integrase
MIESMGVYRRPDSQFFWLLLERPRLKAIREATKIPIHAPTALQRKDNEKLAWDAYNTRMAELARNHYQLPTRRPDRTFAEHAQWYLDNVSVTKRSLKKERSMLRKIGAFWNGYQLQRITMANGLEWRAWRAAQVEESTVNRELVILKHLLTTAVPTYIDKNPLSGLKDLDADEVDIRILSDDEEARLLTPMPEREFDVEERAIIICGLDTLQRLGSVTTLTWSHDRGTDFRILNAKVRSGTGYGRVLPISSRLRAAIDAMDNPRGPHAPIFPHFASDKPQQCRAKVWKMFKQRCAAANIPTNRLKGGASFHCLRHTGATRMLAAGADPRTVMELGGWKRRAGHEVSPFES